MSHTFQNTDHGQESITVFKFKRNKTPMRCSGSTAPPLFVSVSLFPFSFYSLGSSHLGSCFLEQVYFKFAFICWSAQAAPSPTHFPARWPKLREKQQICANNKKQVLHFKVSLKKKSFLLLVKVHHTDQLLSFQMASSMYSLNDLTLSKF